MLYFCCVCRSTSGELKRGRGGLTVQVTLNTMVSTDFRVLLSILAGFLLFQSILGSFSVSQEGSGSFLSLSGFSECYRYFVVCTGVRVMQGLIIPPLGNSRLCLCVFRVLWCV